MSVQKFPSHPELLFPSGHRCVCLGTKCVCHIISLLAPLVITICDWACENMSCGLSNFCYSLLFTPIWYGHTIFRDCAQFNWLSNTSKYYISVLRYVSSNHMVYFSPRALFSQARSHITCANCSCDCMSIANSSFLNNYILIFIYWIYIGKCSVI